MYISALMNEGISERLKQTSPGGISECVCMKGWRMRVRDSVCVYECVMWGGVLEGRDQQGESQGSCSAFLRAGGQTDCVHDVESL